MDFDGELLCCPGKVRGLLLPVGSAFSVSEEHTHGLFHLEPVLIPAAASWLETVFTVTF